MSSEIAIKAENLSKCFHIYDQPQDRLKQFALPRIQQLLGRSPKQYFREFWALKDVSFDVKKGETIGIIGRNGSGKSTLLQLICGTLEPTSGTIELHGRVAALLELGAGFNPEFTGRENIYLNASVLGLTKEEIDSRLDEIISFADIGEFIEQPVKTYSSGMYVRLAFAIAINISPQILVIDEALAVGDARFQAKCMRRIKEIQESGATILFVGHDVGMVRTICNRAIWLEKGQTKMWGDVFTVTGCYMEDIYTDDTCYSNLTQNTQQINKSSSEVDHRPVSHWGSHLGIIRAAGIYNSDGQKADVIKWNEEVEVHIYFTPPPNADRTHLSVAFSIKDLKGTDLIVSTTHDRKLLSFKELDSMIGIIFKFKNPLVTGKYLLVVAIEDRSSSAVHYYEYLEGAHYFSSLSDVKFFGIFQPEIKQQIITEKP